MVRIRHAAIGARHDSEDRVYAAGGRELDAKLLVEPYSILNYIIDNYSYSGLKGLIIIGIMAMVMSTADSYISSAAVLFLHDFCEPLGLVKKNNKLFFSRAFCFSRFLGSH